MDSTMKKILTFSFLFLTFALQAKDYEVKMYNRFDGQSMIFSNSFLKIEKGDSITFRPQDKGHNSTAVKVPEGANKWQSGDSKEYKEVFEKQGLYLYECTNHVSMGMVGIVQVGKVSKDQVKEFVDFFEKYRKKIFLNKKRLDTLIKKVSSEN